MTAQHDLKGSQPAMARCLPRILMVGNFLSEKTGRRTASEDLRERLQKLGATVLTTSSVSNPPLKMVDIVATIMLKRGSYDVANVDVYSSKAFLWAEVAAALLNRLKKPLILSLHGGNLPQFGKRSPVRFRKILERANVVCCPSEYMAGVARQFTPNVEVAPNSLDLGDYPKHDRKKLRPKLLWLRSFHSIYNPDMAIRALRKITQDFPDATLTLVGPDKKDGTLAAAQKLVHELNLSSAVEFILGVPKAEVPSVLSQHDIFLNTSTIDNMPVSVLEAMACGLCVISTRVGGIETLLDNESDAILVPSNDATAMATAIHKILMDDNLASSMIAHGYSKAHSFDWESNVKDKWLNVFQKTWN